MPRIHSIRSNQLPYSSICISDRNCRRRKIVLSSTIHKKRDHGTAMKIFRFLLASSVSMLAACAGPLDPVSPPDDSAPVADVQDFLFPASITQVTTAEAASFVLLSDGSVWGFTTVSQRALVPEKRAEFYGVKDETPIRIEGLDDITSIAFRFRHGCALHRDGTVSCWGDNRYGQLGLGHRTSTPNPSRIEGLDHVVQIDVGEEHSCALLEDGQIACWGNRAAYDAFNPLKDGSVLDKTPWKLQNLPPMRTLALSRLHSCAMTLEGSVQCWGNLWPDDDSLDITLEEQLGYRDFRLTEAPAQLLHGSCALQKDGSLACACQNEEGSMAKDKLPCYGPNEPISTFGANIISADMQGSQVCGIFTDGAIRCKGGFRSAFNDVEPWEYVQWEQIDGLTSPEAISVGVDACAIDDGCVRCFGPWIGHAPKTIGCFIDIPVPR